MTRFTFLDREKATHDVAVLCRLLKVSRCGYYAWRSRPASKRAVADGVLTTQIRAAFEDNRPVYGAPRLHAELADAGVRVGRKRVARLMRAAEIVGCHRRKRSFSITRQNPAADIAPDRVDRKIVATAPNQLWVADATYVPTVQGWPYLACVTDWGHPLRGVSRTIFALDTRPRGLSPTRPACRGLRLDRDGRLAAITRASRCGGTAGQAPGR